jgi:hypothetical protein
MMISKFLLASLLLSVSTSSFAGVLNRSELTSQESAEVDSFVQNEVRADLTANFEERVAEVSQKAQDNPLLMGEPLSPETRALLGDAVYRILFAHLANKGVYLAHKDFDSKVGKALNYVSKLGFFPRAFTVGYMARYQRGIGGSYGTQFNFYIDQGKLKMSSYTVLGVQAGYQAGKPTLMTKIEFYAAFCFGACVGGDAVGYYLGLDGYAGESVGGGAFIEAGLDVTDYFKYKKLGKSYSFKDLYQAKAIYVGFGYDLGFGAGISANALYYSQDYEKTLGDLKEPLLTLKVAKHKLY